MKSDALESLSAAEMLEVGGGFAIDPAARYIMMHESGGSTTAGHLYPQGRGDGTRGNHSSAFGAFQMIQSTRRAYMGSNYQSTNFGAQYSAATHYVDDKYGSWSAAERYWKKHRNY